MVVIDLWQAAPAPHTGPTATEWILAAVAIASQFVTLYVARRQHASTLAIAKDQNETSLRIGQQQNTNALALAQQQNETALRVARQQVLADVVSASRRQWLDTLRQTVAEYLASAGRFGGVRAVDILKVQSPSEIIVNIERLTLLYMKLRLLLNPAEPDHIQLADAAGEVVQAAVKSQPDTAAIGAGYQKVMDAAQRVLKREWERVKAEPNEW